MEGFNQLRENTENSIKKNEGTVSDLATWKEDIRDMVMRVRSNFLKYVDEYCIKLKQNLLDMEGHPIMKPFVGEDRR